MNALPRVVCFWSLSLLLLSTDSTAYAQSLKLPKDLVLPKMSVSSDLARGMVHLHKKEFDGAVNELEKYIKGTRKTNPEIVYFARALDGAGRTDKALEVLESAVDDPAIRAAALLERASIRASTGDLEQTVAALRAAIDAEYCPRQSTLRNDRRWSKSLRSKEIKSMLKGVASPAKRYHELCIDRDEEGLSRLWQALRTRWDGEDYSPVYLIQGEIDAGLKAAAKTKAEEHFQHALFGAKVADRVFRTGEFTKWVDALRRLGPEDKRVYFSNWKTLRQSPGMFRSHRFKQIVQRYAPIADSAQAMGDTVGRMSAQSVLGLGRYCLVEYKVSGFELDTEWRESWKCYVDVYEAAVAMGDIDEEVGALINFLYLLYHPVDKRTREYKDSHVMPVLFYVAAASEGRLPEKDRSTDWIARSLGWQ